MSEAFVLKAGDEYIRENGERYSNAFGVAYGHKECLERDFISKATGQGGAP
jgi:hypothetical protein